MTQESRTYESLFEWDESRTEKSLLEWGETRTHAVFEQASWHNFIWHLNSFRNACNVTRYLGETPTDAAPLNEASHQLMNRPLNEASHYRMKHPLNETSHELMPLSVIQSVIRAIFDASDLFSSFEWLESAAKEPKSLLDFFLENRKEPLYAIQGSLHSI